MVSENYALLFRLNPDHWPVWEERIPQEPEQWFRTGRRVTEHFVPGIPSIILGTGEIGIVGDGETTTRVEFRPDPYAYESGPSVKEEYERPENRVRIRIGLKRVPIDLIKKNQVADRLRRTRRETTTWLSFADYQALRQLIDLHIN